MKNITVYTDGAFSSKRNVGSWAAIIIYPDGIEKELSGTFDNVTNNQMEMWAIIEALDYLRKNEDIEKTIITVVTDSEYVVKGKNQWLKKWQNNNWKTSTGPVKNKILWETLVKSTKNMKVEFSWVKGHCGNEYNERVDKLAVKAYKDLDK